MNKLILYGLLLACISCTIIPVELKVKLGDNLLAIDGKYTCRFLGKEQKDQKKLVFEVREKVVTLSQEETTKENPQEQLNIRVKSPKIYLETTACIRQLEIQALEGKLKNKIALSAIPPYRVQIKLPRGCKGHKWLVDVDQNNDLIAKLTHW